MNAASTSFDSSSNISEPVLEFGKELTPMTFESLPNIRIIKILRIAIKEATLDWVMLVQVPKYRGQHNGILS